jgi:hypothetical protein
LGEDDSLHLLPTFFENFNVRFPEFVQVPGGDPLLKLLGVDWLSDDSRIDSVAQHPHSFVKVCKIYFSSATQLFSYQAMNVNLWVCPAEGGNTKVTIRSGYQSAGKCIPCGMYLFYSLCTCFNEVVHDGMWQIPCKPNYSLVFYFGADRPLRVGSLLHKFVHGDDTFRNSRLKLNPRIVEVSGFLPVHDDSF